MCRNKCQMKAFACKEFKEVSVGTNWCHFWVRIKVLRDSQSRTNTASNLSSISVV